LLDNKLRSTLESFLMKIVKRLSRYFTANQITLLGLTTGLMAAFFIAIKFNYLAILLLAFSALADILDGLIARHTHSSSDFGCCFDICADRIVEAALVIGLFLAEPHHRALWCLVIMASNLFCVTTFLIVSAFDNQPSIKSLNYSPGLMERAEAGLFCLMAIILPQMFSILAVIYIILVNYTAMKRFYEFYCRQNTSAQYDSA
jgi:archaetidylinositol phosphate synthase